MLKYYRLNLFKEIAIGFNYDHDIKCLVLTHFIQKITFDCIVISSRRIYLNFVKTDILLFIDSNFEDKKKFAK